MRTTITLDADVELILRQVMQQTGQSFKVTLNEAVRRGLADVAPSRDEMPFVVEAQDMGVSPGIDIANVHDLETELEVDAYLEVNRKLEERHAKAKSSKRRSKS